MTDHGCRAWIFQANPQKYDLRASLANETQELWGLRQHARDVHAGDRVYLWMSGPDAGIYAAGTVLTEPMEMPDNATGIGYWLAVDEAGRVLPRVIVAYERVFLDAPIPRAMLRHHPVLGMLAVIRAPRGTVYAVTPEEDAVLSAWLGLA